MATFGKSTVLLQSVFRVQDRKYGRIKGPFFEVEKKFASECGEIPKGVHKKPTKYKRKAIKEAHFSLSF